MVDTESSTAFALQKESAKALSSYPRQISIRYGYSFGNMYSRPSLTVICVSVREKSCGFGENWHVKKSAGIRFCWKARMHSGAIAEDSEMKGTPSSIRATFFLFVFITCF